MKDEVGRKYEAARSFWSLERRVPLLVWALLATMVTLGLLLSYGAIRNAGRDAAEQRLARVNQQITAVLSANAESNVPTFREAANDERLRAYLRDPATGDSSAAAAALEDGGPLSGGALHLRTADGAPLVSGGGADTIAVPRFRGVDAETGLSPFVIENNHGAYWVAAPVRDGDRTLGWITSYLPISGGGTDALLGLIGRGSTVVFGSRGDGAWIDVAGRPIRRPLADEPVPGARFRYRDAAGIDRMMRIDTIRSTPWVVGVGMPLDLIDEAAHEFLGRAAIIGILLTLVGAGAAWAISRRITTPILRLRSAAAAIAAGEYARRVPETRSDELGDLARTFNTMTTHIQAAHSELENRYERAQSLAMELEIANEELEEAMAETDAMRLKAQEANRAKSEFLATMSHEIRTPINAMIGYADLLELGVAGGISREQHSYLERIKASGAHLTKLIDEVLDFAKIEAGQLRVLDAAGRATEAIERAIATIEPEAREKGVTIRHAISGDCWYQGDPQRVEQILLNLLSNGVKFTAAGGWVEVRATDDVKPKPTEPELLPGLSYVRIAVTDNGIGIADTGLDDIFEPFVQGDSGYTREHGGTGLGLSISRRLARLMGGDVTVEERTGGGSVFALWLRRATRADQQRGASPGSSEPAAAGAEN